MDKSIKRHTNLFFSDIVGYSSMVAKDESHALNLLAEHDIILKKHIKEHGGTIIKHIGDAIFAEFDNSQSAINASLAIQTQLHKRNDTLPATDKVIIRIGLHAGEVVATKGDLFGNQVNLCSRIESIAIEGSIACSNAFHENIHNVHSRCYGYIKLKNIPQPEKVYRIYNNEEDYLQEKHGDLLKVLESKAINIVETDEILYDYKSIAFLYPENLGSDENEFLCYEFLEQLIENSNKIELIRSTPIIDVLKFKESKNDISQISIELAVDYVAQISLLAIDNSFKGNILIIDMNSGTSIYRKDFHSEVNELMQVTGSIIIDLAEILNVEISDTILKIFKSSVEVDSAAYKLFLQGKKLYDKVSDPDSLTKSKELLSKSIEMEPGFVQSYAALCMTNAMMGEYEEAEEKIEEAIELAVDNQVNDDVLCFIHNYAGLYYKTVRNPKKAIKFFEKALKNQKRVGDRYMQAKIYHNMANCYSMQEDHETNLNLIKRSQKIYKELDVTISVGNSYAEMGISYNNLKQFDESIAAFNKAKPIYKSLNMNFKYAQAEIIQADVYLVQGEIKQAKNNIEDAKIVADEMNNPMMNGRLAYTMGRILYQESNVDEAIDCLDDALDIFQDLNNKLMLIKILILQANIYIDGENHTKAEKLLEKADKYMLRTSEKNLESDILNARKRLS